MKKKSFQCSILCSWISSKQQIITLCTFIHILSSPLLSKAFVTRTKNSRLVSEVSIYNVRGSKFCWLISISISNQMESHHVVCVSLAFLGQKKWLIWISFIKTNKKTDRALIRTFFFLSNPDFLWKFRFFKTFIFGICMLVRQISG